MKIGYARVSTLDQNLESQTDALSKAGCEKIFTDRASGAKEDRQGLVEAIEFCRAGDSLVVWKLDRLGRSLKHLIETINELHSKGVGLISVQESIDTTTSGGKLIFHLFGALAEFERELIRERTNAGLASARARGRLGGRPKAMTERQIQTARAMLADPNTTVKEICDALSVSKSTLYRYIKPVAEKQPKCTTIFICARFFRCSPGKASRRFQKSSRFVAPVFISCGDEPKTPLETER